MAHAIHSHKHSFHHTAHLQRRSAQRPKESFWTHLAADSSLWVALVMFAFGVGLIGYAMFQMSATPEQLRHYSSISYD